MKEPGINAETKMQLPILWNNAAAPAHSVRSRKKQKSGFPAYLGVILQRSGQPKRRLILPVDSQVQGLHAPQDEVRSMLHTRSILLLVSSYLLSAQWKILKGCVAGSYCSP
jgi:hypothetical protein